MSGNQNQTNLADEPQAPVMEAIRKCLASNHGNTLPMLEVMRACKQERPYREVEEEVDALPIMHMSHQSAHFLAASLVAAGAIARTEVVPMSADEDSTAHVDEAQAITGNEDAPMADHPNGEVSVEGSCQDGQDPEAQVEGIDKSAGSEVNDPEDQPIDYTLMLTASGAAVLDEYEPTTRFRAMLAEDPESYADVYARVLTLCEEGVKRSQIEDVIRDHPALREPKRVYPGFFISRLETVNAIAWENDRWITTPAGIRMCELL